MTTLTATSRMVARNRIRSDLSFLAISAYNAPCKAKLPFTRNIVSGQQSSAGLGWRHQLRRPGQPAFPAASPSPQRPTDDCSPLTIKVPGSRFRVPGYHFLHALLERVPAFRVVAEHVEARAGGREQHH